AAWVRRPFFNLSHSGHLALYALSDRGPVGVDIECARRPIDEIALAGRAFGAVAQRRLGRLDPASRRREFLIAWARHEAELKRRGSGIGGRDASTLAKDSWIAELDLGPRAAGAVAAQLPPREMHTWEWVAR